MTIDENPLSTEARVIEPPMLRYHESCRQPSIVSLLLSRSLCLTRFRVIETKRWNMEYVRLLHHF